MPMSSRNAPGLKWARNTGNRALLACLLLALLPAACTLQAPYLKEGKEYGVTKGTFRGRWWSYYERGVSFLSGEYYEQAESDFLKAIRGRSRDIWNARTYGLHFVEYFPNRELGVAYFHMGRLDEAETYLKIALDQVDTERARRYLDLVTKKRIEAGLVNDEHAPELSATVQDGLAVPTRSVSFKVGASDDVGLDEVAINDIPFRFRGNAAEEQFREELFLDEGIHAVQLRATDLAGKVSESTLAITVDLTGPAIGIIEPTLPLVTPDGSVRLRGAAVDATGVAWVGLDGVALADAHGEERVGFDTELPLNAGENTFVLTARDVAGNETATAVSIYRGSVGSGRARLWRLEQRLGRRIELAGVSAALLRDLLTAAEQEPEKPVAIAIKYPNERTDIETYRKPELRVAGRVDTQTSLKSFSIRGDSYPIVPEAKRIEFSRRIPVAQGENPISVVAEDIQGHRDEWQGVVRGAPVILDEFRMKVAVQHFKGLESPDQDFLRATLEGALQGRNRFEVVTRTELDQILEELHLGSSALADPNFALRLGKIKPADVLLYAIVYPRNDGGLEILCQAIGTETALILAQYDAFVRDATDTQQRRNAVNEIAAWLGETFPRVSGELAAVVGKGAWVNIGQEDGLRKGMKVVVTYEAVPAEKDPATGKVLEEAFYDALGWAAVVGVEAERGKLDEIRLMEGHEGEQPTVGQPVFTM